MPLLKPGSPTARRREFQAQLRLRATLEPRLARSLAAEFKRRVRAAARAFETDGRAGVAQAMNGHGAEVLRRLSVHHRRVFTLFGDRVFEDFKSAGFAFERKDTAGIFESAIDAWLDSIVEPRAVGISMTTQAQINDAIRIGVREGDPVRDIARRILEQAGGIHSQLRAMTIAQTETHAASTFAQEEAVTALGIDEALVGEWISAADLRTRETHLAADGQTRPIGKPFDVGGAKLLRPGDPAGPAQEVINCRCVVGYAPAEG